MIVAVNAIYAIAKRSLKKIQDFKGIWTRDLAITGAMLYQLSYEATDVVPLTLMIRVSLHMGHGIGRL